MTTPATSFSHTVPPTRTTRPGVAVALVATSTLLSMSAWFSATFVVPQLTADWHLGADGTSALTIAVQLGFVIGALLSAASGIADAVTSRSLMCIGGIGAATCNAGLLLCDSLASALPLRLATGLFLAAVYPPALEEVSTWFLKGRGKALGVMIGALTLGSALPHLVSAVGGVDWQVVIAATSVLSALGGFVVLGVRGTGPYPFPRRPFSFAAGFRSLRNKDVALANLGYIGHMWELYAMWAGVGAFIVALPAIDARADAGSFGALWAFLCIGVGQPAASSEVYWGTAGGGRALRYQSCVLRWHGGGAGCHLYRLACRGGRRLVRVLGLLGHCRRHSCSAMVTESADPDYVGGALSLQLALGYVTTMLTLWVVPQLVEHFSWHIALLVLAIGPVVGVIAMLAAGRRHRRITLAN